MRLPQPGLFAQGLAQHFHVEFELKPAVSVAAIVEAITEARRQATWLAGPNVTWGFSPKLWALLNPGDLPPSVHPFAGVDGLAGMRAPATQWDIWVWCSSWSAEAVATTSALIVDALAPVADLRQELAAYTTADSRDPTGFIDGTENPLADEAYQVALFPAGSIGEGGSAVLIQKWVHKLPEFQGLPEREQEGIMGRTLEASIQLPDDELPTDSHVSRNTVLDASGEERHIYRRNTPFDDGEEVGTQFIGVTNDPDLIDTMLERMFGVAGDGLIDRLAQFSMAVTGSYYFAPAMEALTETFGALKEDEADEPVPADPQVLPTDGNLRIGSLR